MNKCRKLLQIIRNILTKFTGKIQFWYENILLNNSFVRYGLKISSPPCFEREGEKNATTTTTTILVLIYEMFIGLYALKQCIIYEINQN